jgi:ParB/RepB/Spo0J family partition protein
VTTKNKIDLTKYTPTAWPIDKTIDSPLNKRTEYGDVESLAASIKRNGIECALLGRPAKDQPGVAEIVWGKRRRRAAEIAGVKVLPLVLREMTDLEVLDAQFFENQDRKDFTPLEESSLYGSYRDEHKISVELIAERVSRSESFVRRRLKLLDLTPAAQEALAKGLAETGGLELGAGEALACYPPSVQDLALPHLLRSATDAGMTGAQARVWLAQKFTLKLAKPPFDPEDGALVAAAGKCSACPKRTGNQGELFADLSEDTCTDPVCYDAKASEAWARRSIDLEMKGYKVLTDDEAIEVFGGRVGGSTEWISQQPVSQKYVALDDRVMVDGEEKTYRQILGGKAALKGAQVLVARHPRTGATFELLDAKEATALAEKRVEAGKLPELPTTLEKHTEAAKDRKREAKKQERDNRAALAYVVVAVVATITKLKKLDESVSRILARLGARSGRRMTRPRRTRRSRRTSSSSPRWRAWRSSGSSSRCAASSGRTRWRSRRTAWSGRPCGRSA